MLRIAGAGEEFTDSMEYQFPGVRLAGRAVPLELQVAGEYPVEIIATVV